MKIRRGEFKRCARELVKDATLQKIETENYSFVRIGDLVTVKFKTIKGLQGYFTMEELGKSHNITVILKTLEKELDKKNGK
jgi:hypothetical protein